MLTGKFFTVKDERDEGNDHTFSILFDPAHLIFEGHFPGQPVVPGVCMIQIVKELLERQRKLKIQLQKADHLKFLAVISPIETPEVNISMNVAEGENILNVSGKISRGETVFLKYKMSFTVLN